VWTIGVNGSGLRQITHHPSDDFLPRWSRDGRLIYFTSSRTGRNEIWRVPAAGGIEQQVTREGGSYPDESFDGRTLYYRRDDGALLARPTTGGEERTILPCVGVTQWSVGPRGVFHMDCATSDAGAQRTLQCWDESTGQDRAVAAFEAPGIGGLSVSPDGRSIVCQRISGTSDVMMIENFR
jgi:dipeptidyl aminopeptidase/acylaminoacyl peptidase